jgi:hypothetical protein
MISGKGGILMAFDQTKYTNDYSREHYRQYNFRVSKELDQDIIDGIETMRQSGVPINAFIRECIRRAINDDKFLEETIDRTEAIRAARI